MQVAANDRLDCLCKLSDLRSLAATRAAASAASGCFFENQFPRVLRAQWVFPFKAGIIQETQVQNLRKGMAIVFLRWGLEQLEIERRAGDSDEEASDAEAPQPSI